VTESVSKVYADFSKQVEQLNGKVSSQQTSLQQLITSLKQEVNTQLSEYESKGNSKQNPETINQISTLQKSIVEIQQKMTQISQIEKQLSEMNALVTNGKQADQRMLQSFMQESKHLQEQIKSYLYFFTFYMESYNLYRLDQMKGSMEALWSSLGVLSGRIVEVEAKMDQ
jgi:DNA repair exonuclease SbcCD ATPase subunit